ncbi:hypothetical protein B0H21DRAFT_725209 [Amylocystis lapponica]|nr:hypothetical protein B0H21DRAFT_725209 [Amylocystis lapponica]
MKLTTLPEDILLHISTYLTVVDVLSLKQTCRVLHAFGSTDYLWHKITTNFDLPLDIPPGVRRLSLPGDQLQRIVMGAIRLEANWRKPKPHVERTTALVHDTGEPYVDEMYLTPGGKLLVAAQRNRQREGRTTAHLTVWSLEDIGSPYRFASVETSGVYRSSALLLQEGGRPAEMIVATNEQSGDVLEFYSFRVQDRMSSSYPMYTMRTASRRLRVPPHPRAPQSRPPIHRIYASGNVVAVTVVSFGAHVNPGDCPLEILLTNTKSAVLRWVHPRFVQPFSFVWVRLQDGFISILGKLHSSLLLRVYNIPAEIHQETRVMHSRRGSTDESEFLDLGSPITELSESLTQNSWGIHDIATVSPTSSTHLSAMTFYSFNGAQPGIGQVTRFPICPDRPGARASYSSSQWFTTGSETSAEIAQVGATGRRAVWLEHNWETRQKRVMKYQPLDGRATTGVLLPPEPELPFTPSTCHSLAFDEVSGRLCLGLFNGDLYVVDFQ